MSSRPLFVDRDLDAAVPGTAASSRLLAAVRSHFELLVLLLVAATLDLWSLSRNGTANDYYAAGVKAMASSWHAFLYASFDAAGVMTVDKPPLASWVQALSVRVFGFSSWSMLVPQALMGVATVLVCWDVVRRVFGSRSAAFAAGLVLTLTPIAVAMARHNNPDALLALCGAVALWCLVRALENGRTRWVVWCGVAVGLGFETKMAAALLVVPALAAAWLWVAPAGRRRALRQLAWGSLSMIVVGLAWPVLVWLTPAASRPWVSGTSDNSIWSLVLGYNGLGRLFGQSGGPGGGVGGPPGGGGGPGGGVFGGSTGPLRLLNDAMGGQIGWLLGTAVVAGLGVVAVTRLRRSDALRTGFVVAAGGSLLTMVVAFSRAQGIFHPYYVEQLAPFVAVLVGAGVAVAQRRGVVAQVVAVGMVVAGVVVELKVLGDHPTSLPWLGPVLIGAGLAAVAALAFAPVRLRAAVVAPALGLLLVAPGSWAVQTVGHATQGTFPAGGPADASGGFGGSGGGPGRLGSGGGRMHAGPPPGFNGGIPPAGMVPPTAAVPPAGGGSSPSGASGGGGGPFGGASQNLSAAVAYAQARGGGTVAVDAQSGASQAVIAGEDVAAIGGFSGRESQVTTAWLADMVEAGKIRFVLAGDGASSGGGMPDDGRVGARKVLAAVREAGAEVGSVSGLYDLQGKAAALRALDRSPR